MSNIENENEDENLHLITNDTIENKLKQGFTYFDILLYNCYDSKNKMINLEKLNRAIDDIVDIYDKLFSFGLTLSGYQFIGLTLERNLQESE